MRVTSGLGIVTRLGLCSGCSGFTFWRFGPRIAPTTVELALFNQKIVPSTCLPCLNHFKTQDFKNASQKYAENFPFYSSSNMRYSSRTKYGAGQLQ
jgi:hypothetical protein